MPTCRCTKPRWSIRPTTRRQALSATPRRPERQTRGCFTERTKLVRERTHVRPHLPFVGDSNTHDNGGGTGPNIQPKFRNDLVADSPPSAQGATGSGASRSPSSPSDNEDAKSSFTRPRAPKDDEPRTIVVNRCDFQIGYRIDDLGPSGLGKVELFITTDNGRKWYRYGTDPDNKSPFAVSVPADGTYGFELRVRNGAGIGDDPPRPGDKPSIVVLVDKTAPVAQLLPPQIGRGHSRNKVLLRWMAEDAHFGPTPVLLEYAAQTSGPWQKIGDWQANTGHCVWSIDPGTPGKVFVRMTVKDRAGNLTQVTAPDQLVIDFTRPTAPHRRYRGEFARSQARLNCRVRASSPALVANDASRSPADTAVARFGVNACSMVLEVLHSPLVLLGGRTRELPKVPRFPPLSRLAGLSLRE